jgi:hypothetical protein
MSHPSIDARLYHASLYLYPPEFRREFSREILRVFNEARADVLGEEGRAGLWTFRAAIVADAFATLVRLWLRTGWPLIALAATLGPAAGVGFVIGLWRLAAFSPLRNSISHDDVVLLALLTGTVLIVLAGTIILTLWFTRPLLYRHRR